jgi:hypothetical protein
VREKVEREGVDRARRSKYCMDAVPNLRWDSISSPFCISERLRPARIVLHVALALLGSGLPSMSCSPSSSRAQSSLLTRNTVSYQLGPEMVQSWSNHVILSVSIR